MIEHAKRHCTRKTVKYGMKGGQFLVDGRKSLTSVIYLHIIYCMLDCPPIIAAVMPVSLGGEHAPVRYRLTLSSPLSVRRSPLVPVFS